MSQPEWAKNVVKDLEVGIVVCAETHGGPYTTEDWLVGDEGRLWPVSKEAVADSPEGDDTPEPVEGSRWYHAAFETSVVSGEISGSTDERTGRGTLTLVVNKHGAYMARTPLVDLFNHRGKAIASQYALDTGDRYTATFEALKPAEYVVGVRRL
jgi:hypothetical protein